MKRIAALLFLAALLVSTGFAQQCLIVRSAEGHRFRNSMIAGALTGGIGFAAGAASGGAKYEYVDSFRMTNTKLKYKGGELQKLQQQGVHIVVVNKKATADETKSARESCATLGAPPAPASTTATAAAATPAQTAAPALATPGPTTPATVQSQPQPEQPMSLAEMAKKNREKTQKPNQ